MLTRLDSELNRSAEGHEIQDLVQMKILIDINGIRGYFIHEKHIDVESYSIAHSEGYIAQFSSNYI